MDFKLQRNNDCLFIRKPYTLRAVNVYYINNVKY